MKKSKIYIALQHLETYELNQFEKFINSPYFNQNQKLIKYYNYLKPFLKGKREEDIQKQDIWNYIGMNEEYNDLKFRKYSSDLLKLFENYLGQQIYEKNNLNIANNILENVSKKGILNLYNSVLGTAKRLSDRHIDRNAEYYYYLFILERNRFNLSTEYEKKTKKKSAYTHLNIGEMSENLDVFYIAQKLRLYSTLLSWKRIYKLDIELNFINEIIDFIQSIDYEKYPPVAIWYQIYLTIKDDKNTEHYYKLKALIDKYINSFPFEELEDIYDSALNYCIKKANTGASEFYDELLILYKDMLNNNVILEQGKMNPTRFRNIIYTATVANEFDWAENFIYEFKDKLDEKYKDNAVTFNLAQVNFARGNFNKVVEYLRDVEFDDMVYELRSKNTLIRTFYETKELSLLDSLLDSFNVLLNRKKRTIPDNRRKNYKLVIKFVKKLINVNQYDKNKILKLKEEIETTDNFPNKKWLVEKVNELL